MARVELCSVSGVLDQDVVLVEAPCFCGVERGSPAQKCQGCDRDCGEPKGSM